MLIPARRWIRETFVQGSRPTMKQVEQWFAAGEVPGRYFGDQLYIDDSFATHQPKPVQRRRRIDLLA